jgi:hypothetical protein
MATWQIDIKYGFSEVDSYTHRQHMTTGNNEPGNGDPDIDLATQELTDFPFGANSDYDYIVCYLKCLEDVVAPGVKVLSAVASRYQLTASDWNSRVLDLTHIFNISNFSPLTGNTALAGPRGRAFIGGRQYIPASNRYGWTRWHYIAGNLMILPTILTPANAGFAFAEWYPKLSSGTGSFLDYAVVSSVNSLSPAVIAKGKPSSLLHFGLRNG